MKIFSAADIYKWEQAAMVSQNLGSTELMEQVVEALFQAFNMLVNGKPLL